MLPKCFQEPDHQAIGPHVAYSREAGQPLLRRFERKFRCSTKGSRQYRNFKQLRAIILYCASPSFVKENRFVSSGAITEVCLQPIHKTLTVIYVSRFDSPF